MDIDNNMASAFIAEMTNSKVSIPWLAVGMTSPLAAGGSQAAPWALPSPHLPATANQNVLFQIITLTKTGNYLG